ncbi:MAG TPA: zinc-ribbon and DUF3426 domain-containing protein [Caldimonas sp.]|jgi:predicted Zn finger-like uncharacterized protein|nr:zinc-ribbon and DUF3426 domain-containing protein [Caldimonas sp.]HEX2540878.1 zinc-ribbon and DUF3426 domain-containing protein [Caldimonas sp.]
MSLATRCTSCRTVFRVVQDQLKVSEGWVRCGRCESVFNALEGLLDLERETPTGWDEAGVQGPLSVPEPASPPPSEPAGEVSGAAAAAVAPDRLDSAAAPPSPRRDEHRPEDSSASASRGEFADPIDAHLFGPRKRTESAPKPAGQLGARDRLDFSDARFDSDLFEEAAIADEPAAAEPSTVAADLPLESATRPEFIRRADRHARWQSRPLRAVLVVALAVATAALALQSGHHFRDSLAAEWPSLAPALGAWCRLAECTLEAPRRIDAVTVESTALARAPGFDAYVLSVSLRNRSALVLTLPAVDLSLTDSTGRLVSRRVLSAADFRVAPRLAAGAEVPLQLTLATARPVAGYTVEIFYP